MSDKVKKMDKKIKRTKSKANRTAQQSIPYDFVLEDGIIVIDNTHFSKSYFINDINFELVNEDEQQSIIDNFRKLINKFQPTTVFQFTVFNRIMSNKKIRDDFFIKPKPDLLQNFRDEYNLIIAKLIEAGRNDIRKERYLTVCIEADSVPDARRNFETLDTVINGAVKKISDDGVRVLSTKERLYILHDVFKNNPDFAKILDKYVDKNNNFSLAKLNGSGLSTKDLIAPYGMKNSSMHVELGGESFARSFIITDLPPSLDTKFISEISNIPCKMITSISYRTLPRKKAIRDVKIMNNAIRGEVVKANQSAIRNNFDPTLISDELSLSKDEAKELQRDLTVNNQKLFFTTIIVTIFADNKEDMTTFQNIFKMKITDFMCQAGILFGQQMLALKSVLPLGICYVPVDRMLTTESVSAFFPFHVREMADSGGYFYGLHALTRNMIIINRKELPLANGLIFGKSGSGKSYIAKGEIIPTILDTNDDIIIMDPDGEYAEIAKNFDGIVIDLFPGAEKHINPLDLDLNIADENEDPVAIKADYIVSLCESAMGKYEVLTPYDINIIHKCAKTIYADYMKHMDEIRKNNPEITCDTDACPTLVDFYNALIDMNTPESHRLSMIMEPYCVGNYNVFAYRTNIKEKPHFIVFNLKKMPSHLKSFASKVCLSEIWNRVVQNLENIKKYGLEKSKFIHVYLDEFYLLVQNPESATLLQEYYKRIRKYGGIMTGITQDIEDVLITSEGRGILNNSGFVIMMNQSQIGRSELQTQFNIADGLLDYIKNQPPGIGLIYTGETNIPFDYRLPEDSNLHRIMSTKPSDY